MRYNVDVVPREGQMVPDDWHATVHRVSDGERLIFISRYRWILHLRLTRWALDRAFRRHDRRKIELGHGVYKFKR